MNLWDINNISTHVEMIYQGRDTVVADVNDDWYSQWC